MGSDPTSEGSDFAMKLYLPWNSVGTKAPFRRRLSYRGSAEHGAKTKEAHWARLVLSGSVPPAAGPLNLASPSARSVEGRLRHVGLPSSGWSLPAAA